MIKYAVCNDNLKEVIREIPNESGIYGFISSDNLYLYIGKSTNLKGRIRAHASDKLKWLINRYNAQSIAIVKYPEDQLDDMERAAIAKHAPRFNEQLTTDGAKLDVTLSFRSYHMHRLQDIASTEGVSINQLFMNAFDHIIEKRKLETN